MQFSRGGFNLNTNSVVSNLLIINILFFIAAAFVFGSTPNGGYALNHQLGLFLPGSENFKPYQLLTHFFMHGSFMHILFNMYALYMFGNILEQVWGPKKFLIYYFVCAFGAAVIHLGVNYYETLQIREALLGYGYTMQDLQLLVDTRQYQVISQEAVPILQDYFYKYNIPTVGASGAVFGLLLGFGMLFPNTELYLMFIPVPIKAKYFVIGYGLIEVFYGFNQNPGDNVAHFAHLGGMLFGFILLKLWQKDRANFF